MAELGIIEPVLLYLTAIFIKVKVVWLRDGLICDDAMSWPFYLSQFVFIRISRWL